MVKPYPDPNISTFTSWFDHVNVITSGLAMPMFCLTIVVVAFIILSRSPEYSTSAKLLVSFSLGFIFASMLWAAGVLAGQVVFIFLLMIIGSAIANELNRR